MTPTETGCGSGRTQGRGVDCGLVLASPSQALQRTVQNLNQGRNHCSKVLLLRRCIHGLFSMVRHDSAREFGKRAVVLGLRSSDSLHSVLSPGVPLGTLEPQQGALTAGTYAIGWAEAGLREGRDSVRLSFLRREQSVGGIFLSWDTKTMGCGVSSVRA